MKALSYLIKTTIKNRLKKLVRKPGMLILVIIGVLSTVGMLLFYSFGEQPARASGYADIRILYSIIAGLSLMFTFSFFSMGTSQGSTLFTMGDVGLLFVAPISTKQILVYGLVRQLGMTFVSSIFLIFQAGNLKASFGISVGAIFYILFVYAIMLFFCQLISIAVFVYSSGDSRRKSRIKLGMFVYIGIPAVWIFIQFQILGDIWKALYAVIDSKLFELIPVIGWTVAFSKAVVEANVAGAVFALGLYVLFSGIIIALFTTKETDFYESVLVLTENRAKLLKDSKEGRAVNFRNKKRKVVKEKTGLHHGKGASAIFYKHMVEIKRVSRIPFIGPLTMTAMVGAGFACYMIKNEYIAYFVFAFLIYIKFIFLLAGKLTQELKKPYLYMIPASAIKKLIYTCLPEFIQPCIEGILIFGVVYVVGKQALLLCIFLALAYALSGILFNTIPIFYQRFFGGSPSRAFTIFIELMLLIVCLMPGIVLSGLATANLSVGTRFLGTIPYSINCLLLIGILIITSRNVLSESEIGNR